MVKRKAKCQIYIKRNFMGQITKIHISKKCNRKYVESVLRKRQIVIAPQITL